MRLVELQKKVLTKKKGKRLGRGIGSKVGGKSGRGQKGQKSRTGNSRRYVFEGGQTPFIQKIPKSKGSRNINKIYYCPVNLEIIDKKYEDGEIVSIESLIKKKIIKGKRVHVKILGNGNLTKKLTFQVHLISDSASLKVEKAGGKIDLISKTKIASK